MDDGGDLKFPNARGVRLAKFDMKGRLICPYCGFKMPVPEDRWLGRNEGVCPNGDTFFVDDDIAYAVNDILQKTREGRWRKPVLSNFEETPKALVQQEDDIRILQGRPWYLKAFDRLLGNTPKAKTGKIIVP